jgi:hypothetical protein
MPAKEVVVKDASALSVKTISLSHSSNYRTPPISLHSLVDLSGIRLLLVFYT